MQDQKEVLYPPRFTLKDVTIHEKKRLYKKHFALDEYTVSYPTFTGGHTPKLLREIFERDADAVAILPYDPVTDEIVLIEQFRPGALKDPLTPWLFEIVAGMIDGAESELEAAKRELKEESGLTVADEDFHYVNRVYPSPGGVSECVTIYIATVDASHIGTHGGLESENEDLRIFKVKAQEAFEMVRTGRINNAAALIGIMSLELRYDEFRKV